MRSSRPAADHVASALAEHVLAQVDADDPRLGALGQLEGDAGRAGGHVEHDGRVGSTTAWSIISRRHRRSWPSDSTAASRS